MGICREFCEMVEELIEDLDDIFEGSGLGSRDADDGARKSAPAPGDIIGVDRGIYQHYGIYAGDNAVIHYTAEVSDLDAQNAEIQETSLERFLRDETAFFVLECDAPNPGRSGLGAVAAMFAGDSDEEEEPARKAARCYSPEETVARARSRIGERKYNVLANNCEHFAVWCKTGISDSSQVREWVACARHMLTQFRCHLT